MGNLLALLGLALLFLCWWHQRGVKDWALRQAQWRCEQLGLQLLDETVQLCALWPVKDRAGRRVLRRRYRFEFTSTGNERYSGELQLEGLELVGFELPPYAWPDMPSADDDVNEGRPPWLH